MASSPDRSWTEDPELVRFYSEHRNDPADLYLSERRFLPWLASRSRSVLDVGCAAGGFSNIWRSFADDVRYTGVDVSLPLVEAARRIHPEFEFLAGDCAAGLPLASEFADSVQALGWLHWEPRYRAALRELWRLAGRYLFFDVRAVEGDVDISENQQQMAWLRAWDGETTVPYLCVGWSSFAAFLLSLKPTTVYGYGYWGEPAATVIGPTKEVYFASFVLEKAAASPAGPIDVCVGPLAWPRSASDDVTLLPAEELETRVPWDPSE